MNRQIHTCVASVGMTVTKINSLLDGTLDFLYPSAEVWGINIVYMYFIQYFKDMKFFYHSKKIKIKLLGVNLFHKKISQLLKEMF